MGLGERQEAAVATGQFEDHVHVVVLRRVPPLSGAGVLAHVVEPQEPHALLLQSEPGVPIESPEGVGVVLCTGDGTAIVSDDHDLGSWRQAMSVRTCPPSSVSSGGSVGSW